MSDYTLGGYYPDPAADVPDWEVVEAWKCGRCGKVTEYAGDCDCPIENYGDGEEVFGIRCPICQWVVGQEGDNVALELHEKEGCEPPDDTDDGSWRYDY